MGSDCETDNLPVQLDNTLFIYQDTWLLRALMLFVKRWAIDDCCDNQERRYCWIIRGKTLLLDSFPFDSLTSTSHNYLKKVVENIFQKSSSILEVFWVKCHHHERQALSTPIAIQLLNLDSQSRAISHSRNYNFQYFGVELKSSYGNTCPKTSFSKT